jgi:hypothetical protein
VHDPKFKAEVLDRFTASVSAQFRAFRSQSSRCISHTRTAEEVRAKRSLQRWDGTMEYLPDGQSPVDFDDPPVAPTPAGLCDLITMDEKEEDDQQPGIALVAMPPPKVPRRSKGKGKGKAAAPAAPAGNADATDDVTEPPVYRRKRTAKKKRVSAADSNDDDDDAAPAPKAKPRGGRGKKKAVTPSDDAHDAEDGDPGGAGSVDAAGNEKVHSFSSDSCLY